MQNVEKDGDDYSEWHDLSGIMLSKTLFDQAVIHHTLTGCNIHNQISAVNWFRF